ncbi:carbonic anhydrase [Candidatus Woesearchaeota archaeon]|nr:carbonic anhydrase [Candidatus Woesearchaeota archaeon]
MKLIRMIRYMNMSEAGTIVKLMMDGNLDFVHSTKVNLWEGCRTKQEPKIAAVMCSDSRVPHYIFNIDPLNWIFTIKNIGNQLSTCEGSVEYAVNHLKTPVLAIIGHSDCGAIKGAITDYSKESPAVRRELSTLKKVITPYSHKGNYQMKIDQLAEKNVDAQVAYALRKFGDENILVIGMMFDFIGSYGQQGCRIHITNLNGKTNVDDIYTVAKMHGIKNLNFRRIS